MTTILIRPEDFTRNTIVGGSVDVDRYLQAIKSCQMIMIKPLLGKELYDLISEQFEFKTLEGVYLELYEDYVKELVIHGSCEIYLSQGAYMVSNSGITKTKTDTSETISKEEVDYLVQASRKLYNLYETQFLEWIKTAGIPEYVTKKTIRNYGGWIFGSREC